MTPVRVLASAYAATALLVFLQTVVLRAIPYDAAYFGTVTLVLRFLFFAADVAVLVGLASLARVAPNARGLTIAAGGMTAFAILLGLVYLSHPAGLSTLVAATSAIEETMTFASAILVALVFAALARDRDVRPSRGAAVVFAVASVAVMLLRFARASSSEARSIAVAWVAWALAVAQPAALAALAWPLVRTPKAKPDAEGVVGGAGYRGAGRIAAASPEKLRAEDVPPDPSTVPLLHAALRGLRTYRGAFLGRVIATASLLPLFIVGMGLSHGRAGVVVFVPVALAHLLTSALMLVGILRQRALPTLRGGLAGAFAVASFGLTALLDAVSVVAFVGWTAGELDDPIAAVAFPASFVVVAVAISLSAAVQAGAGESLGQDVLARSSRWTQALVVLAGGAVTAAFFGGVAADRASYGQGRDLATLLVLVLVFLAFLASIAVVVVHLRSTGEALRIVRSRLALASDVGSPRPS